MERCSRSLFLTNQRLSQIRSIVLTIKPPTHSSSSRPRHLLAEPRLGSRINSISSTFNTINNKIHPSIHDFHQMKVHRLKGYLFNTTFNTTLNKPNLSIHEFHRLKVRMLQKMEKEIYSCEIWCMGPQRMCRSTISLRQAPTVFRGRITRPAR